MQKESREKLKEVLGAKIKSIKAVSGGDIAEAYLVETATERIFCKILRGQSALEMLRSEKDGLEQIRNTGTIKTPMVHFCEDFETEVCLGMEFIAAKSPSPKEMKKFGEQLSALHRTSSGKFGYPKDNFIGSLPQSNKENDSWASFYIKERLLPQFALAVSRNLMKVDEVLEANAMIEVLSPYFSDITPVLLHGDLWSGNYLISLTGEPYLIDPAVYYGDPMVDLAMTRLFGGFGPDFYQSYHANSGAFEYEEHKTALYQLYYLLVHLNLFGSSYYGSVKRIMKQYF